MLMPCLARGCNIPDNLPRAFADGAEPVAASRVNGKLSIDIAKNGGQLGQVGEKSKSCSINDKQGSLDEARFRENSYISLILHRASRLHTACLAIQSWSLAPSD